MNTFEQVNRKNFQSSSISRFVLRFSLGTNISSNNTGYASMKRKREKGKKKENENYSMKHKYGRKVFSKINSACALRLFLSVFYFFLFFVQLSIFINKCDQFFILHFHYRFHLTVINILALTTWPTAYEYSMSSSLFVFLGFIQYIYAKNSN